MLTIYALIQSLQAKREEERGAVLAEYGVLLAIIAAIVAATVLLLQGAIVRAFQAAIAVLG